MQKKRNKVKKRWDKKKHTNSKIGDLNPAISILNVTGLTPKLKGTDFQIG